MQEPLIFTVIILLAGNTHAFELKGFGDVSFEKVSGSQSKEYRRGSFVLGDVDLYISEQIGDRLDILGEILLELEDEEADVERFHITYTFNDAVKIRAGRFHTPIGFWNTAYHHGAQIQPSIDRPEILKYEHEGGVLPMHTVGISTTGRVKAGASVIVYDLMIGNGNKIEEKDGKGVLHPNVKYDDNYNKSFAFSLTVKPGVVPDLKIGITSDILRIQGEAGVIPTVDVDQTIIAPAIIYNTDNLEIWGEYFHIRNKNRNGDGEAKISNGYYLLLTYLIKEKWMPYILYETRNIDGGDSYFNALNSGDINEGILGLRYNISYRSCIKAEGRLIEEGNDHYNEYAVQWAISF
ncbi:MAG: hypothetical protein HZA12_04650 [Nitrospirae bacterium]|nr:hypothetical protein [Nitrospirota bacterium]